MEIAKLLHKLNGMDYGPANANYQFNFGGGPRTLLDLLDDRGFSEWAKQQERGVRFPSRPAATGLSLGL